MSANIDLSLIADIPHQNMVVMLLTELINFQNGLIACLEEADTCYSIQFTTTVNKMMDKMNEYCRRLQILNRDILELTKRVRLMVSRAQILSKKRNDSIDLLAC